MRSGAAIIYGQYYESDEIETVTLPDNSTSIVIVRRDWGTATSRLTYTAAPITQTPGATYDIPLAQVVTLGGNVMSVTDLREFCEYSSEMQQESVVTEYISLGAITTDALQNVTRRLFRGAGAFKPDFLFPALRVNYDSGRAYNNRWREDLWQFTDGATNRVWAGFRVPEDFTGTTMEVFIYITWVEGTFSWLVDTYQQWGFDCYSAQPGVAFGTQSKLTTTKIDYGWNLAQCKRLSLGTITVSSGDIVLIRIYRNGTSTADTSNNIGLLHTAEFEYEADS